MRRFVISSTLLIAVGFGAIGFAQAKIATLEDYQKVMKPAGTAVIAANKALGSAAASNAVCLERKRQALGSDAASSAVCLERLRQARGTATARSD